MGRGIKGSQSKVGTVRERNPGGYIPGQDLEWGISVGLCALPQRHLILFRESQMKEDQSGTPTKLRQDDLMPC